MLDTTVYNELTFNSIAGTLAKSHPNSKFIRFHMNSKTADRFFHIDKPYKSDYEYVEVLQVMICAGDNFLVEYIDIKECK